MKTKEMITGSAEETKALGALLGKLAEPDMVFLLEGDLGAGKTTLTQGIAAGLDIRRAVKSPTFNLLKIYTGRLTLYHIDAYRLEGISQDLGFDEYLDDGGLTVIEWPQYVPSLIPPQHLTISIRLLDDDRRAIAFQAEGRAYEQLLEELK